MKILVTGSNGFIGKNISNYLKFKGYETFTPSKSILNLLSNNEVSEYLNNYKPNSIIHLASYGISRKENNDRVINKRNLLMIKNIIKYLPENCRLLVTGSMAEYGGSGIFKESDNCYPITEYAKSKLEITNYCLQEIEKGRDIRLCRIFGAYGYGEKGNRLFPSLYKSYKFKKTCQLSDGLQKRDFIHVFDICKCLKEIIILPKEKCRKIINIGTGEAVSIKYVVNKYVDSFGISPSLINFNSIPRSPGDANLLCSNVSNLRKLINFVPPQRLKENENIKFLFSKNVYKILN